MKIFAHRGIHHNYPDNSYLALKLALDMGFSVEADIRLSKDKQLIMFHNNNLDSYKSLKALKFEEVLNLINKYKGEDLIALHIKEPYNQNFLKSILTLIQNKALEKKIFIFDIDINLLPFLKRQYPKVRIGVSVAEKKYFPFFYFLEEIIDNKFIDAVWADEWEGELYNNRFFKSISEKGKKSYAVSPELHNNRLSISQCKNKWKKLFTWGVDGICTDYPQELYKFLYHLDKQGVNKNSA